MISPFLAIKLAYTKLRTHRTRLAISITVVSLLFSILITATILQAGFFVSFDKFSSEGLAGRYIVAGNANPAFTWGETFNTGQNLTLIERAESLQNRLIEEKTAKAEELGLNYDPEWDRAVFPQSDGSKYLSIASEIGKQVIAEYRADLKQADITSFKKQLENLDLKTIHTAIDRVQEQDGDLTYIKDGKEPTAAELANRNLLRQGFGGITQGAWRLMDDSLLESFMLEGQNLKIGNDGTIPIIAPVYAIEQELNLEPLPADTPANQKRERLEQLRSESTGMSFEICYRNEPSLKLFKTATAQQSDKAVNGSKIDYSTPDLLYSLPDTPCGTPAIESDTRTEAEKVIEANWQKFNKEFGQPDPLSQLLKFRVVGIKDDVDPYSQVQDGNNYTPEQIFNTAFNANAGQGWLTPMSVNYDGSIIAALFEQDPGNILGEMVTYYAEFSNAEDARHALLERTCAPPHKDEEVGLLGQKIEIDNNIPSCSRDGRQFVLQPFGGNSIVIGQFSVFTKQILLIGTATIAIMAAVVLMTMIGRIISDSRKETAIFRAVGATRLSIMQIYFAYTAILTLWIIGLSLIIGYLTAFVINMHFSPGFSIAATVAFSTKDLNQQFTFLGVNWVNLGLIVLVIILASYIGTVIPILRSVRRNPMVDLKDE